MYLGFHYATVSGMSLVIDDLEIPTSKAGIVDNAVLEVKKIDQQYSSGLVTSENVTTKLLIFGSRLTTK